MIRLVRVYDERGCWSMSRRATTRLVLLARSGFSPGVTDGCGGSNTDEALHAFQQANGLPAGPLDAAGWARLSQAAVAPILGRYTIRQQDVLGPFTRSIPCNFRQMARLRRLYYRDPRELLAEKFHMSQRLLAELNPGVDFDHAGTVITVADVGGPDPTLIAELGRRAGEAANDAALSGSTSDTNAAALIVVDKRRHAVLVYGADRRLLGFYPATIGSTENLAPSGTFTVKDIVRDPSYTYNPAYHFKAVRVRRKITIAPGPNNPVGIVWIGVSDPG
jgi:lipoprotein-anchoring transpeptidase ErfK/SrfK